MTPEATVLVADGNTALAAVIAQLLADEPGLAVLDVVDTAVAAVRAAKRHSPRVVLVGRQLRDTTGAALCAALQAIAPDAAVLLWSHDRERTIATRLYADGVIERGMTFRQLVAEIDLTLRRTARGAGAVAPA